MSNENENTLESASNQHLADKIAGKVDDQGNLLENYEEKDEAIDNMPVEQSEEVIEIKKNDNVDEGASENEID
jgi:hypothetical protein